MTSKESISRTQEGPHDRADLAREQLRVGHYSKATFSLAKVTGGTRLTFTQTSVPDDKYGEISTGWREYWNPIAQGATTTA